MVDKKVHILGVQEAFSQEAGIFASLTTVSLQDLILHRGLRRKAIYMYTRGKLKRGVCMGVKTTLATSALPTSSLQPNMKGI